MDNSFDIQLNIDKLAKNVYLQIEYEEGFFSDNYFDMLPGSRVTINLDTDITENELNEALTVRTLNDAF